MRLLLLGTAAIALSGCSWMKGSGHHGSSATNGHGYYSYGGDDCCENGKTLARWNVEGAVGPEFFVGGDLFSAEKTNGGAGVVANNVTMENAYDPGMRYELGGSYALNPNRKVTLMANYAQADGEQVNLGSIGGNALTGTVSDYERYGIEAGIRQYFAPTRMPVVRSVRPYVEGKLGAAKVKDIDLENATLGGAAFNGGTAPLYEGGWVPTAAGMVGLEAPVFKRATLGVETGIRYTGNLKSDRTALAPGFGLAGVNSDSSSFSVPVMLRGRYRF